MTPSEHTFSIRCAVLARNTIIVVDSNKLQARSEFHWL